MANITLAPEDDNPDFRASESCRLAASDRNGSDQRTELQTLRFQFNPHKVGFGILPWPGTEHLSQVQGTVLIAMNYLAEGTARRDGEEKK
jgi:hypothetical protein